MSRLWKDDKNHPGLVLALRREGRPGLALPDRLPRALGQQRLGAGDQAPETPSGRLRLLAHPNHSGRVLRVRSYLVSARDHGINAIDAIRMTLAGTPWLPAPRIATPTTLVA